ncbi:hypothetical protein DFP73DRAFT_52796 [Morchella snyderi]|nr:hypothetical protein DFP73DRAFT_52796 [Morchella snyderi]
MDFSVTLSKKAILPLLAFFVLFVGLIIKEYQISVWASTELSIVSFFTFLISLSMLFDDAAQPAENQLDEDTGVVNQKDEPKAILEATLRAASEAVPKETETTLVIPQSPVLMLSALSPIIMCWELEDKAKAEHEAKVKHEEKTEAAAEAQKLKRQRKNKARKEKSILRKQSASTSQSSDEDKSGCEDTPKDKNQLIVYENILSDEELNLNPVLPSRHRSDDGGQSSSAEQKILYRYLASIKDGSEASFIRMTQFAIERFMETLRGAEFKGPEMVRDEEIKVQIVETQPSLQLGPKIEWKSPGSAMRRGKKWTPANVKVGPRFAEKENEMGEWKKAVSTTLESKTPTKDDKTSKMFSQTPVKTSQFTGESIEKPDHKDTKQEISKEEMETNQAPRRPSTEAVAPIPDKETKEITMMTALAPVANEVKGILELEKLFPPLVPNETRVVKTGAVATPKIPETRADIIKAWLAANGPLESTKVTESIAPLLITDETEGSQIDENALTDTTQTADQGPTKTAVQSVEGVVMPALIVSETKEVEELESLPAKILECESIADLNELEASGVESPTLAGGSSTALIELEGKTSTEGTVPSTVEQGQPKEQDEAYESDDDLVKELEELLRQNVPEPTIQSEGSSQVQEELQVPGEGSPAGPEVPHITTISAIQGALEPGNIQEYTEIIAPTGELTADEAVFIDTMMRIIDMDGNIIEGMDTQNKLESFCSQIQETEELLAANDCQTGGGDLLESLNFDDNSLGVVSYDDLEPTAAPHEDPELSIDMEETTRPFNLSFDQGCRDEYIDFGAIFNDILDQDDPLLPEDQTNGNFTNIDTNGPTDVVDQTMIEMMSSEYIPTTDGMEIDQMVPSEDESFLFNQTQMLPEATVPIHTNNGIQSQQNGTGNEFQFERLQGNIIHQLNTSLTASHSIKHFTSISPESSTFIPQSTIEQVSDQETIHSELSIEESALPLLEPTQEIFNLQFVNDQQSTSEELVQQAFTPQVEIGQISPKLTGKVPEPPTSVELSQGTIIPHLPVGQPISVATTQKPSHQITIEQSVFGFAIEQSLPVVPLQDTPQFTQESQISQAVILHPIFSTINPSSTITGGDDDGTKLDNPQKFIGSVKNTLPLIFALQVTEKTSNKRCVEPDDDDEDEDEGTQANMEIMMITKRPVIPLRKKALEIITRNVAPVVEMPKKPKSTTGIRIITTAPTQSNKEIALKKVSGANSTSASTVFADPYQQRTKIEVDPDLEELKAEPNYDSAKVNMQQQLNKVTTKLQAITMEKSITSARQKGMEIDDKGFFQLGLEKNKPRRRY